MADDLAQLFNEAPQSEPAAAVEPAAQTPAPAAATPPAPVAPEPVKPEPGFVPIAAVLDEREKRKDAEKRLAAFEAERQQNAPSVPADPEQLAQYVHEQTQRALTSERFDLSQTLAEEKHGADAVKAAMDWGMNRAEQSPAFAAEYVRQKHPIDWAVRQHKRDQLLNEFGDDEAKQKSFIERRARELGLIPASPPVPQGASAPATPQPAAPQPKPAAPAPSLASAPSAGGLGTVVYQQPKELDRLFGKT